MLQVLSLVANPRAITSTTAVEALQEAGYLPAGSAAKAAAKNTVRSVLLSICRVLAPPVCPPAPFPCSLPLPPSLAHDRTRPYKTS